MANQFDAFQKEVDDDLQRERLQKIFKQYGNFILAGAVAIVAAVAGWKYLDAKRTSEAQAAGKSYIDAVRDAGSGPEGAKALQAIAASKSGYGLLARLRLAATDAAEGRADQALVAYEAIASQSGVDRQIADFARLQTAMLKLDTADWTDIQNRVNDLATDDSPWRHAAREILGLAAYKAGKVDVARGYFGKIVADQGAPRSISERAGMVLAEIAQAELAKAMPPPPVVTEQKPNETKPAETKPADVKPAEAKPAETKSAEPPAKKKR